MAHVKPHPLKSMFKKFSDHGGSLCEGSKTAVTPKLLCSATLISYVAF